MNQIFDYNGQQIRTVIKDGEPWFVLADLCKVLEIDNSGNVAARLDEDEKGIHRMDTLGGKQDLTVIDESGLYSTILLSRKPEAKKFKRWVTGEVLPTIRKHGVYMTPETIEKTLYNPDFIINLAKELKSEREQRIALEGQVEQMHPKALFADSVTASPKSILVGEQAKLLNSLPAGSR